MMALRLTTYQDIHDEFYYPAGMKKRDRRPMREVGYDMGKNGVPVSADFLSFRARLYNGQLNAATHTIDQRADFVSRRSGDWWRNLSLLTLAITGIVIVALAMMVDYRILHDFWTMVYANEFLEVPESLKESVAFKSLQVLFAVIALHFLISQSGWFGSAIRGTFMVGIGVMVLGMLVGLGFLSAKSTLPETASIGGLELSNGAAARDSQDALLQSLGLRPSVPSPEAAAAAESGAEPGLLNVALNRTKIDDMETLVFFGTFGLIFLFVSSVGALCLHYSLHSLQALFGGTDSERREHATATHHYFLKSGEWRPKTRKDLDDQQHRIRHARTWIGNPVYRSNLMDRFLAEFAAGYMDGLMDRIKRPAFFGGSNNREEFDQLRDEMRFAVQTVSEDWTPDEIAAALPDNDTRQALGYQPQQAKKGGFLGLGGYRRTPDYAGDTIETIDTYDALSERAGRTNRPDTMSEPRGEQNADSEEKIVAPNFAQKPASGGQSNA